MNRYLLAVLGTGLALGLIGCSDDDETTKGRRDVSVADTGTGPDAADTTSTPDVPSGPPKLNVEPAAITFRGVRIDETETVNITLANNGTGPLTVAFANLSESDAFGASELKKGANWVDDFTVIEAGTFADLDVVYTPKDHKVDRGSIEIATNDPELGTTQIRIESVSAYADLEAPGLAKFGTTVVGESATQTITIFNRGEDALTVTDIAYTGQGKFSVNLTEVGGVPTVLNQNEDYVFDIVYAPSDTAIDRGTVTITSDDPDQGTHDIALVGNEPSPCLGLSAATLDFGELTAGTKGTKTLGFLNCGAQPLTVSKVEISDDGGGVFVLDEAVATPLDLAVTQAGTWSLSGTPVASGEAIGELTIESDDPASPTKVALRASTP